MKKLLLLVVLATLTMACKQVNTEKTDEPSQITTYYLIRHAEKDRSDKSDRNPNLTEKGQLRADNWANYFKDIPLDAVYSTTYKRTIQTATPTALSQDLTVQSYDAGELYSRTFEFATKGQNVLVVGHSNTTPMFVNAILGEDKFEWMNDKDNASLFVVTVKDSVSSVVVEKVILEEIQTP